MEVCPLSREVMLLDQLNLYPTHYRRAFAFSILIYPLLHRLPLQVAFPMGKQRAYHVPYTYLMGVGSACSPMAVRLRQGSAQAPAPAIYLLVQACQHLWLVDGNDVYQRFTWVSPLHQP
jgi:hypothetical protein